MPTTGSITGKLVDANNKPVSYASVALWRTDSTVVNGDLSKDDGSFTIMPTGTGSFLLVVQSIGVTTKYISVQIPANAPDKNMGNIKVAETETALNAVSIVAEKPLMELQVDKKVFNVEKNTTTAGGSAADVLQNVPSVSVDVDGNVSLRGKSDVTILIDGKPSTLLGSDVASALQSLPAGSIESVEVITNPSAKYDAQGSTGIINIVTKKDGRFGMNGNITLGAGTHDKYNGNLGLNARKGKWNVFLNSSYRENVSWNNVTTTRYNNTPDPTNGMYQNATTYENVPHTFKGFFNTIGATYDVDKNNSITLTQNINKMDFSFNDNSDYSTYNTATRTTQAGTGAQTLYENRASGQGGGPFSTSTALDYKHKFKKKDEELSIDGTFAYNSIKRTQNYTTRVDTFYPVAGITPYSYSPITENAPASGNNNSVNVWADYTDPLFTENGRLGLGFKSQFYYFNSSNNPVVDSNGQGPKIDSTLLSSYNYTQQIHAGYINWSDKVGKFSYQAGLRLEDAVYSGYGDVPTYATFHNSYLDLFPSAFISYQLPDQQSLYLNYSRRTNRPGFRQLLPFLDVSNPGTVNVGNPGLDPEFINNVEFSYSKSTKRGDNFILSVYYSYTQNLIQQVTIPIPADKATLYNVSTSELFSTPVNIASGTTYGAEATGHVQLLPIWDATVNANFFQNQLLVGNNNPEYSQYLTNNSGFTWFAKINTNLKLPKNFSFQVNANYNSPQVISQGTLKQTWWMDLALRKNFWKNKATLVVNCSDVFKTHQFVTYYNLASYNETINRVKETRVGNVTFTYRFGKSSLGKQHGNGPDGNNAPVPSDEDRTKNLKQGDDNGNDQGGGGQGAPAGGTKPTGTPGGGAAH
jgi:outer membrane receptor protein involved in Fe transport